MLNITKFQSADFKQYASWFSDSILNEQLGPAPNQAWLQHVLNEPNQAQFCVFDGSSRVAVVGVCFPTLGHPSYTITDLAVNPAMRGRGIGRETVELLIQQFELKSGEYWQSFVDDANPAAMFFFERIGWMRQGNEPDQDKMWTFIAPSP